MTLATLRRRYRTAVAAHDWFEDATTAIGVLFLALAAICVWALVVSIASLGDPEAGLGASTGFLQATRGFGIVLFGLLAILTAGVGWFMAGEPIRRAARRLRRPR